MALPRQLTVVMLTDLVGFATRTQQDEAAALALVEVQERIVRPLLPRYGGREVKTMGDAFLVEFESALAATQCAIELQRSVAERNRRTTSPHLVLRIGIHVGDVVRRERDIYGDTVNIVSRVTPTAEPGGICVTAAVFDQVRNKVDFSFRPLDAGPLKHIDLPVGIYRIELPWLARGEGRLSPFTGRDRELGILRQKIDVVQQGEGGVLVLSGEVGIGKTRLAEEAVKYADRNGFRVLRGRAQPGELALPYSHWAEAIREFLRTAPPQMVYKVCGKHAAEIARLVPEVIDIVGPVPALPGLEPEQARFRFFQAIVELFENISKEVPLLLFFDELQWADHASLRLLQQAAPTLSRHRLLLLGAYTEMEIDRGGPFQEVLHTLHREHLLTQVHLSRFDLNSTREFIAALLGGESVSRTVVDSLFETTGGNPFYLEEVLRTLLEEGAVVRGPTGTWERTPTGEVELPTSIRDVVHRRLQGLSEEDRRLLSIAAVLGADFRPGVLASVAGVAEADLVEPIERMLHAQLLRERVLPPADVSYSFTDAQLRTLLYDELSYLRRRGYHQRTAAALLASRRAPDDSDAAEIAFHFLRGNDPSKALEYTVKAAERAAQLYSHEDAARHYRGAVELAEAAGDERRKCGYLKLFADQELYLYHLEPGVRSLREAAEGLEKLGEPRAAADLFRQVASWTLGWLHDPGSARESLDRARALLEGQPEGKELAAFYLEAADLFGGAGRSTEASEFWTRAQNLVARLGDAELEVRVELGRASDQPLREKEKVFEHLHRAEQIALQHRLLDWLPVVYFQLGLNTIEIRGDATRAQTWFERCVESARKVGDVNFETGVGKHMFAYSAIKRGELAKASRLTDELLEFLKETFPHLPPQHLCGLSEIAYLTGDYPRSEELLGFFDAQPPEAVASYCRMRTRNVRGRLSLAQGNAGKAKEAFSTTVELFRGKGRLAHHAALGAEALSGLVEAHVLSGDPASAKQALNELAALAEEFDEPVGYGFWYFAQGALAAHEQDLVTAAGAYRHSADAWRRLGWMYLLALTDFQLARMYRAAGRLAEASEPLRSAIQGFTEMGAQADLARARELEN